MKTYMAKGETVERSWYVVDAENMVLGRLSSQVAAILRGKHKPTYTPHVDTGDHVIIVNAAKVRLTAPVAAGQVLIHDLLGTGADLVATRALPKAAP